MLARENFGIRVWNTAELIEKSPPISTAGVDACKGEIDRRERVDFAKLACFLSDLMDNSSDTCRVG